MLIFRQKLGKNISNFVHPFENSTPPIAIFHTTLKKNEGPLLPKTDSTKTAFFLKNLILYLLVQDSVYYVENRFFFWLGKQPRILMCQIFISQAKSSAFELEILLLFAVMKTIFLAESNSNRILQRFRKILFRKAELRLGTHTTQNSWNKWTKISDLETIIFELDIMVKSGLVSLF